MRKVSFERYYFVLYDGVLTVKMSKMVLNPFCDKIYYSAYITWNIKGSMTHQTFASAPDLHEIFSADGF